MGNIRAEAKQNSHRWQPLVGYDVQKRVDSLRFTLRVSSESSNHPLIIRAKLLRFTADSLASHPITNYPFNSSSLRYKGIDYSDSTIIHQDRRALTSSGGIQIRFRYRRPPRGNYRFVVQVGGKKSLKARDFGIKSMNFPAVKNPKELARPLAYLIGPIVYTKFLQSIRNDTSRKGINHFWRTHVGDSAQARKVAAKFYRHVEVANRRFSNYKEGWKTDRGHIYIMYGRPLRIDTYPAGSWRHAIKAIIWLYSFCNGTGGWAPAFWQMNKKSDTYPFTQFLMRADHLPGANFKQQKHWLSGGILKRKFWDEDKGSLGCTEFH